MSRKWRYVLCAYVAGALLTAVLLVQSAYLSGGLERPHAAGDFLLIAAVNLAMIILWPLLILVGLLQYFGVLPYPITL
jgi:hypothetical protein